MEIIQAPTPTKARKNHRCNFCCGVIERGTTYHKSTMKDDTPYVWKNHISCGELAEKMNMYKECYDGVTTDDFQEFITNEFWKIHNIEWKDLPPFDERLKVVLEHHKIK